ncbi:MAG: ChaN family lipoprotein [Gemmatimonadaceae bacterium]
MSSYSFLASMAMAVVVLASTESDAQDSIPAIVVESYVPHRVFDARKNRFSDFETMLAELAKADVVFLGEQHDDTRTHRLQAATLEGLDRRREGPIVLALEMFERDVQPLLDSYLAGSVPEGEFLAGTRPWPNYRADYRPMVEYAKSRNWPVVAGNVPRRLAQVVSRRGLGAIDSLPDEDRALVARDLSCPPDDYAKRFAATMGDMSGHGVQMTAEQVKAMVQRFYEAQCVKDETMAEAIALAGATHGSLVVHANGSFHSDYRMGTAARVRRRLPGSRVTVVSFVPVEDLDRANGKSRRKLGDWVVFTLAKPKPDASTPTGSPN